MTARRTREEVFVSALALCIALTQTAAAQSAGPTHRLELGGTLGVAIIAASGAQTMASCNFLHSSGEKPALGLRGGYRLKRWLLLEATFERDVGPWDDGATVCPPTHFPRQPRSAGLDTVTSEFPSREEFGLPAITITTVRAAIVPWSTSWSQIRLYGGVGRIWYLHASPVIAGLNGRIQVVGLDLLVEAEVARYAVPIAHRDRFYQDGALLDTHETLSSKKRIDATIRFGIAARL